MADQKSNTASGMIPKSNYELISLSGGSLDGLEEQRLLIDRALDKLRGEIKEKELNDYLPMMQRQVRLIRDHVKSKEETHKRIQELENLLAMQDQTISCLLDIGMQSVQFMNE